MDTSIDEEIDQFKVTISTADFPKNLCALENLVNLYKHYGERISKQQHNSIVAFAVNLKQQESCTELISGKNWSELWDVLTMRYSDGVGCDETNENPYDFVILANGTLVFDDNTTEMSMIRHAKLLTVDSTPEDVTRTMLQLISCIRYSKQCTMELVYFKPMMNELLNCLDSPLDEVIIAALKLLKKRLTSTAMKAYWLEKLDLFFLKFVDCRIGNPNINEIYYSIVYHMLELAHLPLDATIDVLKHIILKIEDPKSLRALSVLNGLFAERKNIITKKQVDSILELLTRINEKCEKVTDIPVLMLKMIFILTKSVRAMDPEH